MSTKQVTTCDGCRGEIEAPGGLRVTVDDLSINPHLRELRDRVGEFGWTEIDVHNADCLIRWVQESRKVS